MRYLLLVAMSLAVGGAGEPGALHGAEAQAKLDKWLGGRVAGKSQVCVPVHRTRDPIGIDDRTILFRDGPRVWRSELQAAFQCGKLDKQSTIVTESKANRLCSGDKLVIVHEGTAVGACVVGDFVPYTRP